MFSSSTGPSKREATNDPFDPFDRVATWGDHGSDGIGNGNDGVAGRCRAGDRWFWRVKNAGLTPQNTAKTHVFMSDVTSGGNGGKQLNNYEQLIF